MSGDWIPVRLNLHDDPGVIGIALAVKLDEFSVVGRLLRLWSWASSQTQDGWIPFVTPEKVDQIVQRAGFAAATAKVRWLEFSSREGVKGVFLPNFDRWMSESSKKRFYESLKKRRQRANVPIDRDISGTNVPSPVMSCNVFSPEQSESESNRPGVGGLGEGEKSGHCRDPAAMPPEVDLAQKWCFYCTRKRLGASRDIPNDIAAEFKELLRLGYPAADLEREILAKSRDRGEHFWQFKDRVKKVLRPNANHNIHADLMEKYRLQRERIDRERAEEERELAEKGRGFVNAKNRPKPPAPATPANGQQGPSELAG